MANSPHDHSELPDPADLGILTTAMPADTNPSGDIFGGWLMSQMDLAAGNIAARLSKGRVATIAVDGMVFLTPVQVGDEVTVYAKVISVGRTSMKMKVELRMDGPFLFSARMWRPAGNPDSRHAPFLT